MTIDWVLHTPTGAIHEPKTVRKASIFTSACVLQRVVKPVLNRLNPVKYSKPLLRFVQIRPRGHSMRGKVNDGNLVALEPCDPATLQADDLVLVKVRGRDYLHLIKTVGAGRFQIGNNRGHINGWVGHNCIYGKATKIES